MNKFITFLFAILFTIWTIRLYYKLYDKKTRRYILLIGLLIVFWMLIRIIKGIAVSPLTERMCWYLYYLPLIFIPSCIILGSICKFYVHNRAPTMNRFISKIYFFNNSSLPYSNLSISKSAPAKLMLAGTISILGFIFGTIAC